MRGQHTLFNSFNHSFTTVPEAPAHPGFGRNKSLYNQRNLKLCYRYYYKIKLQRKQYPDALESLSNEFDLTICRIIECLEENRELLQKVMAEKLTTAQLNKLYPWLRWD